MIRKLLRRAIEITNCGLSVACVERVGEETKNYRVEEREAFFYPSLPLVTKAQAEFLFYFSEYS